MRLGLGLRLRLGLRLVLRLRLREGPILEVRVGGVEVEVVLSLGTTFSVRVGWLGGWRKQD